MASLQSLSDSGQFHSTTAHLELPTQKCCRDPIKNGTRFAELSLRCVSAFLDRPKQEGVNAVFSGT